MRTGLTPLGSKCEMSSAIAASRAAQEWANQRLVANRAAAHRRANHAFSNNLLHRRDERAPRQQQLTRAQLVALEADRRDKMAWLRRHRQNLAEETSTLRAMISAEQTGQLSRARGAVYQAERMIAIAEDVLDEARGRADVYEVRVRVRTSSAQRSSSRGRAATGRVVLAPGRPRVEYAPNDAVGPSVKPVDEDVITAALGHFAVTRPELRSACAGVDEQCVECEQECAVCMVDMLEGDGRVDDKADAVDPLVLLPCGCGGAAPHAFHSRCFARWCHSSASCPLCRRDLRTMM